MTNEEIRKLLGGYATNTLSEAERKTLFDAALEDQELFDALQKEQPLKELLADPVARAHVRQALENPAPKNAWWSRWWAWTGVAGALAATVAIFGVMRLTAPQLAREPVIVASKIPAPSGIEAGAVASRDSEVKAKIEQPKSRETDRLTAQRTFRPNAVQPLQKDVASPPVKDERAPSAPLPPPPALSAQSEVVQVSPAPSPKPIPQQAQQGHLGQAPAPPAQAQNQAATTTLSGFRETSAAPIVPAEWAKQLTTGGNAIQSNYTNGPLLRYSVIRPNANAAAGASDADLKAGDFVQLSVSPGVSGYLALYELDSTGDWRRTYPVATPGIPVMANTSYAIPDAPIRVPASPGRLRLVLAPTISQSFAGALMERSDVRAKKVAGAAEKRQEPRGPLVVDVTIQPKN